MEKVVGYVVSRPLGQSNPNSAARLSQNSVRSGHRLSSALEIASMSMNGILSLVTGEASRGADLGILKKLKLM